MQKLNERARLILEKLVAEPRVVGRSIKYGGNGMKRVVRGCSSYLRAKYFPVSL